jgi:hypothetical protein
MIMQPREHIGEPVIANAHDHLLPQDPQASIDMREYLTGCCHNLGDALRDVRQIVVNWMSRAKASGCCEGTA